MLFRRMQAWHSSTCLHAGLHTDTHVCVIYTSVYSHLHTPYVITLPPFKGIPQSCFPAGDVTESQPVAHRWAFCSCLSLAETSLSDFQIGTESLCFRVCAGLLSGSSVGC